MDCPKCKSSMNKVGFGSIEVDRCTVCGGLWFDVLEKEELKRLPGSDSIDTGDPHKGSQYNAALKVECPVCHTLMTRMVDAHQPQIWYEKCPVCCGTFFDAGEFKDFKHETLLDFFKRLGARERR